MPSCSRIAPGAEKKLSISITIALVACVFALAAHASSSLSGSVEFTRSPRGHVLVPVSIDGGEPLVFVLDTAAGKSLVTPSLAERLGLRAVPDASVTTLGTHGSTNNPVVQLRSIAIGNVNVANSDALVLDLDHVTRGEWRADGILGMDILRQFDVRLDFREGTLNLYSAASDRSDCAACPAGLDGVAFETIDPAFIVLPATVDEVPVGALLDTGAGHSGLNGQTVAALGVKLPPMPAGAAASHGFGLQTGPVRVGDSTLNERPTLYVMDHPVMEALGLADRPAMLMGTDQLAGQTVTICYELSTFFVQ